jgi:hypothetical protein
MAHNTFIGMVYLSCTSFDRLASGYPNKNSRKRSYLTYWKEIVLQLRGQTNTHIVPNHKTWALILNNLNKVTELQNVLREFKFR